MHLYIHVPFCARRCTYCDFAIAVRKHVPTQDFVQAILREWQQWQSHQVWDDSPALDTIYFGGGTPSHLDPSGIERMISRFASDRSLAPGAEVTLEANPDDVSPAAAAAWRSAGINRVSLGVQSFEPSVLEWMHRTHTADQVPASVQAVRGAGIADLSLDLIFGLPASLGRPWERDLERALALEPEHLSLYGLTVEEHTPLGRWTASGRVAPVDEERYAEEFLASHEALGGGGTTTTRYRTRPGRATGPATTPPTGGGRLSSASVRRRTAASAPYGNGTSANGRPTSTPVPRESRWSGGTRR